MKFIYKNKTIITILIAILCIMLFNVRVLAENETIGGEANVEAVATEEKFTLSQEKMDLTLNSTSMILMARGGDTSEAVTWASSDSTVATVENGRVTPLKIGTTTITATRGNETASCEVNVIYRLIDIHANKGRVMSDGVNLVLDEHETETLCAKVQDGKGEEVKDAKVEWTSSDSSIVTVEKNTGMLKAIKTGKATITATAAGVSETCEVTVYSAPEFTDFSKAKCEIGLQDNLSTVGSYLKISGITPKNDSKNSYHYIITSNNTKPTLISSKYGGYNLGESGFIEMLVGAEENYLSLCVDKELELNQDLYLWVLQRVELEGTYVNEDKKDINSSIRFCIEGEKIQRPEIKLDKSIDSVDIYDSGTIMKFNFPSNTENRKFSIKIGKVTNYEIVEKIKNNEYSGTIDLLEYSKNNEAIYTDNLTTTGEGYYHGEGSLFELRELLNDGDFYYIYVIFDDENGKYYQIEGVRLAYYCDLLESGNSYLFTINNQWDDIDKKEEEMNPSDKNQTIVDNVEKKMKQRQKQEYQTRAQKL